MANDNQFYSSPELERASENPDQKREEDQLTRGLEDVRRKTFYEGGEPIHPDELQRSTKAEQPEADKESQPGDRELLRNQKEIIEDARRALGELNAVASDNNSAARGSELNGWLATAINKAEQAGQNPPIDQDHRLVADRLHVIGELIEQSKELVSTYKNYESKFKQVSEAFKTDSKEAMNDFKRAIENHDADELSSKSAVALDKLKSDQQRTNSLLRGFNAEVIAIYSKMDGLSSRYYAPTERMAESQLGQNQDLDTEKDSENISTQQESSDMMRGINEFRGNSTALVNHLSSQMSGTIDGQQKVIKQIEEINFRARKYEVDGDEDSQRRSKADRLG